MKLFLILPLFMLVNQLLAQDSSISRLETQISNGNSKQWTLDSTKIFLGDTCVNGLRLTFFLNPHILHEKICQSGKWVDIIYGWKIVKRDDSVVPILLLYNKTKNIVGTYRIQVVQKSNTTYLRLRKVGSAIEETVDFYFK